MELRSEVLRKLLRFPFYLGEAAGAIVVDAEGQKVVVLDVKRSESPRIEFARLRGLVVAALWHSHPLTPPFTSSKDIEAINYKAKPPFPHIISGLLFRHLPCLVIYSPKPLILHLDGRYTLHPVKGSDTYLIPLVFLNPLDVLINRTLAVFSSRLPAKFWWPLLRLIDSLSPPLKS